MPTTERVAPVSIARAYFAAQAVGGALWWIAVFASDDVGRWTLGRWDPSILVAPDLVLFVGASAVAAVWGSRPAAVIAAVWSAAVTVVLAWYGVVEREAGAGVVLMTVATVATLAAAATIWFGHLPTRWFFVGPFSFHVAEEATGSHHLRRSLTQLVLFWTSFFVVVPLVLFALEERLRLTAPLLDQSWVRASGVTMFVLGSALGLWSCVSMALLGSGTPLPSETARDLVVAGPYRAVRNPMAVAGVLQTTGIGFWVGSWMVLAVAAVGAVTWNVLIRPEEEADLADRFGEPYQRYTEQVRCWIPRLRP